MQIYWEVALRQANSLTPKEGGQGKPPWGGRGGEGEETERMSVERGWERPKCLDYMGEEPLREGQPSFWAGKFMV